MNYNSVPEYFYKLYNRLYILVLIPLLTLTIVYWFAHTGETEVLWGVSPDWDQVWLIPVVVIVVAEWSGSIFFFRSSLKKILTIDSLGDRLDKYHMLTLARFSIVVSSLFILVLIFYFTHSHYIILLFIAVTLSLVFFWPTSAKVCADLKLKGDERTLVLYKMEKLH
jgi:hypothetical protein